MSRYFDIVLCGTGIYFDNLGEQPVIGFLTARRVAALNPEDALRRARHQILVHWNQSYNAERKLGVPKLECVSANEIKRWIHRHPNEDYFFFDTPERKQEHLAGIHDSARPWYRLSRVQPPA
ncbi:hypothetical protein [Gilvimarinus algae]|uniref:Uncharacterized protein n=1 Tax=Gilvimarinus algae TaxID=3058037 RepID=A0ABT8TIG4_9GAMM|nr:hypothetical protein [Gilvimarinus sp. SDUM040014]MDO3382107.1 hypothetical protein [Gilvimarinus sp. SDUM040014]